MDSSVLMKSYLRTLAYSAAYSSGSIQRNSGNNSVDRIIIGRSLRDVDDNTGKFVQEVLVPSDRGDLKLQSTSPSLPKSALQALSPSATKEVSFTNKPAATPGSDALSSVEITFHDSSEETLGGVKLDLSSYHGAVIGDTWFGGTSWSHDEVYLAYVAKVKNPKKSSHLETFAQSKAVVSSGVSEAATNKYEFVEDWGEKYTEVNTLGLFILNTVTGSVIQVPGVDVSEWTVGQPQFVPSVSGDPHYRLAYTAWAINPRRMGMIYCYHRPCAIFLADITSVLAASDGAHSTTRPNVLLSQGIVLARSPRAAPDGRSLVFLGHRKGYITHGGCSALFRVSLSDGDVHEIEEIVSAVDLPSNTFESKRHPFGFPGLFLDQLPVRCFTKADGSELVCSSLWGSVEELLRIDVNTKEVTSLLGASDLTNLVGEAQANLVSIQTLDASFGSQEGADVLVTVSACNMPPRVLLINWNGNALQTRWAPLSRAFTISNKTNFAGSSSITLGEALGDARRQVGQIGVQVLQHNEGGIPFQSILLTPPKSDVDADDESTIPLILVPHGGPHSCMSTTFVASYAYLAITLKVAVLHVNYRGSTGFGQRSIESLTGSIGTNDVKDMMTAMTAAHALTKGEGSGRPLLSRAQIGVVGGSHGGFLGAHLAAQFPDTFRAIALRNPVTDIAAMMGISDIADWCYVEALGAQRVVDENIDYYSPAPSPEYRLRMWEVSPVAHRSVVTPGGYKAATLICLGMKDRRVPASQGLAYYQLLRRYHNAQGVPLQLLCFPEDVHAIDLPATEAEHWVAIAQWMHQHMQL